jgi:1,2-dihydroxy-3-keto-5-methylthiopentene dioxygenase
MELHMAVVRISEIQRTLTDQREITAYLAGIGIDYESWELPSGASEAASSDAILAFYSREIEALKQRGGYVTADVIDVRPDTPGLDQMLDRFRSEHWHNEDEVRFIVEGRGVFHVHPKTGPVVGIEVGPGDMIRVPCGTLHWFDLCADRRIRAIRLFQDSGGWTPYYTESGVDRGYQPVCLGSQDIPGVAR